MGLIAQMAYQDLEKHLVQIEFFACHYKKLFIKFFLIQSVKIVKMMSKTISINCINYIKKSFEMF